MLTSPRWVRLRAAGARPPRPLWASTSTADTTATPSWCSTGRGALGIDYNDVVQTLEDDGVAKFDASWDQRGEQLAAAL
jgi:transaldolase